MEPKSRPGTGGAFQGSDLCLPIFNFMKEQPTEIKHILKNFFAKGMAFEDLKSYVMGIPQKPPCLGKLVTRTFDENYPAVFCKKDPAGKFNFYLATKHQDTEYINLGNFWGKDVLEAIKEFVKQEKLEAQRLGKWYGKKEDSPNVCMR